MFDVLRKLISIDYYTKNFLTNNYDNNNFNQKMKNLRDEQADIDEKRRKRKLNKLLDRVKVTLSQELAEE